VVLGCQQHWRNRRKLLLYVVVEAMFYQTEQPNRPAEENKGAVDANFDQAFNPVVAISVILWILPIVSASGAVIFDADLIGK
jgi:hypothetical protein